MFTLPRPCTPTSARCIIETVVTKLRFTLIFVELYVRIFRSFVHRMVRCSPQVFTDASHFGISWRLWTSATTAPSIAAVSSTPNRIVLAYNFDRLAWNQCTSTLINNALAGLIPSQLVQVIWRSFLDSFVRNYELLEHKASPCINWYRPISVSIKWHTWLTSP